MDRLNGAGDRRKCRTDVPQKKKIKKGMLSHPLIFLLYIEEEVDYISVFHDIFFAF